jgi:hypothetical protein
VVSALAAPLALAAVAATPASAAPFDIHVAGDPTTVNGGAWVWGRNADGYSDYRELQWRLFGGGPGEYPRASFGDANFVNDGGMSPLALNANVDVFFSGAVPGGYTSAEEQALMAWVRNGGVLIANPQTAEQFNTTDFLPGNPTLRSPVAQWEEIKQPDPPVTPPLEDTHSCQQNLPTPDCVGINSFYQKHSAPRAATIQNASNSTVNALVNGPHGTVSNIRNWHTVTVFNSLPANAVEVARLTVTCTNATVTTACSGEGSLGAYDNNISGAVVGVVPFGASNAQYGKGAVVVTSDGDVFSNAYGPMEQGNYRLALNTFQWIADELEDRQPPPVTPGNAADATGRYHAVTPTRVYDTRAGAGKINGAASRAIQITGLAGVPADATAVALNLTATNQEGASFLTVYPTGGGKPATSNLNIPAEPKDVANAVAVRIGDGGRITIANENNRADVIVDVVGYWSTTGGDTMQAINSPTRILDTRAGSAIGEGEVRTVQVAGLAGVPGGATGVVANVTATDGTRGGFLTVFPEGDAPDTSSVNFQANSNVPNLVFAPLAADGTMKVRNAFGETDVIIDVVGYFGPGGTTRLAPVTPDRLLDTRATGKVSPNGVVTFDVRGRGGVDATAQSVLINVTVDDPGAAGFLTAFPEGGVPEASNVNFVPNQTVANLALARIGADGKVRIANNSPGSSQVIADVFAWFGPGV